MTDTSHTTGDSTQSSTISSTRRSTSRQPWQKWTKEEIIKIQKKEIRDEVYLACRRNEVDDFLAEHFPNRTKPAIWQKVWQIEKRAAKFCNKCGSKIQ